MRDLSVVAVVGVVWGLETADEGFLGLQAKSDLRLLLDVVLLVLEGVRCRLPSLLVSMLQLSVVHQEQECYWLLSGITGELSTQ